MNYLFVIGRKAVPTTVVLDLVPHAPPEGAVVVGKAKRSGAVEVRVWNELSEARRFAVMLVWDNRPSKVSFFAVRSPRRVRYGIQILRGPHGPTDS
jgi:hypothetical protein